MCIRQNGWKPLIFSVMCISVGLSRDFLLNGITCYWVLWSTTSSRHSHHCRSDLKPFGATKNFVFIFLDFAEALPTLMDFFSNAIYIVNSIRCYANSHHRNQGSSQTYLPGWQQIKLVLKRKNTKNPHTRPVHNNDQHEVLHNHNPWLGPW